MSSLYSGIKYGLGKAWEVGKSLYNKYPGSYTSDLNRLWDNFTGATQERQFQQQREDSWNMFNIQNEREDNAYQRLVNDMTKAGLNPLTASDLNPQSGSSGSVASPGSVPDGLSSILSTALPSLFSGVVSRVNNQEDNATKKQIADQEADIASRNANTNARNADTNVKNAETNAKNAETNAKAQQSEEAYKKALVEDIRKMSNYKISLYDAQRIAQKAYASNLDASTAWKEYETEYWTTAGAHPSSQNLYKGVAESLGATKRAAKAFTEATADITAQQIAGQQDISNVDAAKQVWQSAGCPEKLFSSYYKKYTFLTDVLRKRGEPTMSFVQYMQRFGGKFKDNFLGD